MFKSKKTIIRVGVLAAAALVAFGAPAAFAASSYNVTAGSAPAGTIIRYTATSPQVTFTDTTSGTVLNCASASATGTVTVGTISSGTPIGTVDGTIWNTCTGPGGISLAVTGSGTWGLNATGNTVGGVTPGNVSAVSAHVSGGGCDFDVTGTVDGTYTNGSSNGTLTLPGTTSGLTISNASFFCGTVGIGNGDLASFRATYQVVADNGAYNPIQIISSP